MADLDGNASAKQFHPDTPATPFGHNIRGASNLDWGMQNRLARILNPATGRTVMLAFDHGYFQGPTSGLERIDLNIAPLAEEADALMCTRGSLRTSISPATQSGLVLRASGGPSVLKELSDEYTAMAMHDAVRINADAVAVQVFVGGENESRSIRNLTTLVCPASSSWQDFFYFKGGDGGVGQAQVHLQWPVPGDRFVGALGVVLDSVVLGPLDQGQRVGDLVEEQPLVLQCPEPPFA
jgi:hypothetical protein